MKGAEGEEKAAKSCGSRKIPPQAASREENILLSQNSSAPFQGFFSYAFSSLWPGQFSRGDPKKGREKKTHPPLSFLFFIFVFKKNRENEQGKNSREPSLLLVCRRIGYLSARARPASHDKQRQGKKRLLLAAKKKAPRIALLDRERSFSSSFLQYLSQLNSKHLRACSTPARGRRLHRSSGAETKKWRKSRARSGCSFRKWRRRKAKPNQRHRRRRRRLLVFFFCNPNLRLRLLPRRRCSSAACSPRRSRSRSWPQP